jgi:hypothetical protein
VVTSDEQTLLIAIADDWHTHMAPRFRKTCCIAASAACAEVCSYFGVSARLVSCDVIAWNALALTCVSMPVERWPPGAWSVGAVLGDEDGTGDYSGHLVLRYAGRLIVDLTAGQMSRPQHGLVVPPVVTGDWRDCFMALKLPDGCAIMYEPNGDEHRWRAAPDYKKRHQRAGEMIRRLKAALPP